MGAHASMTDRQLQAARERWKRLHWGHTAPANFSLWQVPDPRLGPLVELGALSAVEYDTDKRGDGPSIYRHEFGREDGSGCPILAVNSERRLIVVGGYYTVGKTGIRG